MKSLDRQLGVVNGGKQQVWKNWRVSIPAVQILLAMLVKFVQLPAYHSKQSELRWQNLYPRIRCSVAICRMAAIRLSDDTQLAIALAHLYY